MQLQQMKCLNCQSDVTDNFCPNCGQKRTTQRFSLRHILDAGIINGVFMINKGFLFTVLELFRRPGHSIRAYLQGQRIRHFNAFSFLILLIAISYFVNEFSTIKLSDIMSENGKYFANSLEEFVINYPRLIYLINIPLMALSSFLFFRKSSVNLAENIILNTYISSALLILTIPFTLLSIFYTDKVVLSNVFQFISLLTLGYSFWVYCQFFSEYQFKKTGLILRAILTVATSSILQGIAYAIIVGIKNLG